MSSKAPFRFPNPLRLILCLLVVFCVAVGWSVWQEHRRRGPFWQKYQQVQYDMTVKEVEAILGPPSDREHLGGGFSPEIYIWEQDEQWISVEFLPSVRHNADAVIRKRFHPEPWWKSLRDWLFRRSSTKW
jgi:hypothetical protein